MPRPGQAVRVPGRNRTTPPGFVSVWNIRGRDRIVTSLAGAADQIAAEEARLVAQIAAGDVAAPVTELYRRYGKRLYRFGLQLTGDSALAEEMVQECFVRLCRDAERFDVGRGSVGGYLFEIARSSIPDGAAGARELPPKAGDADQILDSLIVHEALDTLSPAHGEVLRLARDEGLTQSQIAARLGLPAGTVKTRMFYGMQALRSALAEQGSHAL
jgi:RNA polymerase sigma-70 factor, ECF subfamily